MNSYKPLGLGLTIGLLVGLLLAGSHQVFAKRDNAALELPLSDIRLFTDIYARIKKDYVEDVGDRALLEGAGLGPKILGICLLSLPLHFNTSPSWCKEYYPI